MHNIFKGNEAFNNAIAKVNAGIDSYTSAVVDLGYVLGIQLIAQTRDIQTSVNDLTTQFGTLKASVDNHTRIVETALNANTASEVQSREAFLVPYAKNPLFTGRESYLEQIRIKLLEKLPKKYNHRVAIHGLGGIGKTQIAIEYAHRHRGDYNFVFWLHAAERASLVYDLATIAKETNCIVFKPDIPLESIAMQVVKWLKHQPSWLVILDNLDDVTVVRGLIPETDCDGHTLITTRCTDVKQIPAEGLEITEMDEKEAIELLLDVSEYEEEREDAINEAREIVRELGCLPLAIGQAAAFIRSSDLYSFMTVFQSSKKEFLADNPEGNHPYPRSISMTWSMCLRRLSADSNELVELLSFLESR